MKVRDLPRFSGKPTRVEVLVVTDGWKVGR